MADAAALTGGFQSPVFDSSRAFRSVLEALARPGAVQALPALTVPPPPLWPSIGAILCALCDQDTQVWTDIAGSQRAGVAAWLLFQTGAALVTDPGAASLAVITDPAATPSLSIFAQGTSEYPDRSATLILQVETLAAGSPLRLAGPGTNGTGELAAAPLPADFPARMAANHALFPLGVDLILAAPDGIAGLPRSTRVEAA